MGWPLVLSVLLQTSACKKEYEPWFVDEGIIMEDASQDTTNDK